MKKEMFFALFLLTCSVLVSAATCPNITGTWTVTGIETINDSVDCISITVKSGATLTVDNSAAGGFMNITTQNLTVEGTGKISADGTGCSVSQSPNQTTNVCYNMGGGPGYGEGADVGYNRGASGGGYGGEGGKGWDLVFIFSGGKSYGNASAPNLFGSGGGTGNGLAGGSGGGLLRLIISDTFTLDGSVTANGNNGDPTEFLTRSSAGGGSGGSIWVTTNTLSGSGYFRARGGEGKHGGPGGGGGGGGRIAVYYRSSSFDNSTSDANGGPVQAGYESYAMPGEDGTIIFAQRQFEEEVVPEMKGNHKLRNFVLVAILVALLAIVFIKKK